MVLFSSCSPDAKSVRDSYPNATANTRLKAIKNYMIIVLSYPPNKDARFIQLPTFKFIITDIW